MTMAAHTDGGDVLTARPRGFVCGDSNGFNRNIILAVKFVPLDRTDSVQGYKG
jgi:hypothetical protein